MHALGEAKPSSLKQARDQALRRIVHLSRLCRCHPLQRCIEWKLHAESWPFSVLAFPIGPGRERFEANFIENAE